MEKYNTKPYKYISFSIKRKLLRGIRKRVYKDQSDVNSRGYKTASICLTPYQFKFFNWLCGNKTKSKYCRKILREGLDRLPEKVLFPSFAELFRFLINKRIYKNAVMLQNVIEPQIKENIEKEVGIYG